MEQEGKEPAAITRGQNVVYQMPHDWSASAAVLAPALDRLDASVPELQLVIATADAEGAAAATAEVMHLTGDRGVRAIAATSAKRATRLMRANPVHVVAGAPGELLALLQGSSLKLEHVRVIVLAWVDDVLAHGDASPLETLMAEMPKEAARVIVASEITADVEALIERYARRARRVAPAHATGTAGTRLEYVTVSAVSRLPALRRLLDELDPPRAVVYVRSDETERDASDLLRVLGYGGATTGDAAVRVARGGSQGEAGETDLVILYDVPASSEELREAVGAKPKRVVALAQPRQLAGLRVLSGDAATLPLTLPDAGLRARTREEQLRTELRQTLEAGAFSREVLALEPLLERYDGIEIAAAALRLLQQTRIERDLSRSHAPERGVGATTTPALTRLFLNIGAMDNVRPGDLVGAITNEAGITSAQIGKIDIRENHSLVEVASDVSASVVSKLTGIVVRGRRLVARVDQERPGRGGPGAAHGRAGGAERGDRDRGGRFERGRRERGERGPRREGGAGGGPRQGGFRERGAGGHGRGTRGATDERADRAARPPRPGDQE